ncbi:MAG: HutD family protein [Acidobacteria bacterium]|nr:HutD family protein [Acidobacteriota bacterium]
MAFLHLRSNDYLAMPWRDGGGVTEQIAIEPPEATLGDGFLWRLSMARVERSGPFSRFEGYDRTLLLLEGALDLDFGAQGQVRMEEPFQPIRFSGDWEAHATLAGGPARDLGIISNRTRIRQEVRVLRLDARPVAIEAVSTTWLILLSGSGALAPQGLTLAPLDAVKLEGESSEVQGLSLDARCLLVRFEPRTPGLGMR